MMLFLRGLSGKGREITALRETAARLQEWFDSAMVMVDNMPLGVAWSDPQKDFAITYVNETGKAMLGPVVRGGADGLAGQALLAVFPDLASRLRELSDPARMPLRLEATMGALVIDLRVVAISNAQGIYTGAMAVWSDVTQRAQLARAFETNVTAAVEKVVSAVGCIETSTRSMAALTDEAKQRSTAVASAAGRASGDVHSAATTADALTASLSGIAIQVTQASSIADKAVAEVRRTDETMRSLSAAAQQIGEVVDLIQAIAGQTNLLALNATIEAARAGDSGKGFAVVASEVKSLASQTGQATDQIRAQIEGVRRAAADAVEAMKRIGATIAEVGEAAGTITTAVEQQGTVTRAMAGSMGQAVAGASDVSANITAVMNTSSAAGTTAADLLAAVAALAGQSTALQGQVAEFLTKIRVA
jgi:methyl-accepting chemotaxis protein